MMTYSGVSEKSYLAIQTCLLRKLRQVCTEYIPPEMAHITQSLFLKKFKHIFTHPLPLLN